MRLTPHDYSPSVLGKIVRSAAREPSFREAAEAMADLAEVTISGRQLGRIAQEVGQQLQACRDHYVIQFQTDALEPRVATRPALAVVEVNGGRLQIRGEGEGPGAHEASWREDKIAILATMTHVVSTSDPEPELPDCFRDRGFVEKVIGAIGGDGSMGPSAASSEVSFDRPRPLEPPTPRTGPELAVRTYVASTCPSDQFGPMVAAEARRRQLHRGGRPGVPGGRLGLDLGPAGVALPDLRAHRSTSSTPWATCSRRPRPRRPTNSSPSQSGPQGRSPSRITPGTGRDRPAGRASPAPGDDFLGAAFLAAGASFCLASLTSGLPG